MAQKPGTAEGSKVMTRKVRISYAHIWTPQKDDNGIESYSVAVLIPKEDEQTLGALREALDYTLQNGGGAKLGLKPDAKGIYKLPAVMDPIKDGDEKTTPEEAYAGHYYINAKSKEQPQVMKLSGGQPTPVIEKTDVYSGCYCSITLNSFAYNNPKRKGVSFGLGNILKIADGKSLGGRTTASQDFGGADLAEFAGEDAGDPFAN